MVREVRGRSGAEAAPRAIVLMVLGDAARRGIVLRVLGDVDRKAIVLMVFVDADRKAIVRKDVDVLMGIGLRSVTGMPNRTSLAGRRASSPVPFADLGERDNFQVFRRARRKACPVLFL